MNEGFAGEARAARPAGLDCHLMRYEQLVYAHDAAAAVRRVPAAAAPALAIYRGWMLRPSDYQALYDALGARGITLILLVKFGAVAPNFTNKF